MFRLFLRDKNDENCFLDSVVPERVRTDKNRTGTRFSLLSGGADDNVSELFLFRT